MSRKALTSQLDRVASALQSQHRQLGLKRVAAYRLAYALDKISDHLERTALDGDDVFKEDGFDPEVIGVEVAGPLEVGGEIPDGHYTQQGFRELGDKLKSGDLGATVDEAPRSAEPGRQAKILMQARKRLAHNEALCARLEVLSGILQGRVRRASGVSLERVAEAVSMIPWGAPESVINKAALLVMKVSDNVQ